MTDAENVTPTSSSRFRAAALHGLAASVCLIASFANFLNFNGYPVAEPEVAIAVLVLACIGIALGILCARLKPRERALLMALFLAIVVEINIDGGPLLIVGTIGVALLLKNRSIAAAGITFSVVLLFQTAQAIVAPGVDLPAPMQAKAKALPVIVHVILDEGIGIEGLPSDMPETVEAATWGRDKLIADGFVVFGAAFAQHMYTVNSVPTILGLGHQGRSVRYGFHYKLVANSYWAALKARGYSVKVYRIASPPTARAPRSMRA